MKTTTKIVSRTKRKKLATAEPVAQIVMGLRSRIRCADYDDENLLLEKVEELLPALKRIKLSDPITYFSGLGVCAQIYDYFGLREKAKAVVAEDGEKLLQELPSWVPSADEYEHSLLKLKVWMILHYANTHYYRFNDYDAALFVADKARELVKTVLRTPERPCHGTAIRISFFRGQILRQQGEFPLALQAFRNCMKHTYENLKWRDRHAETGVQKERLREEEIRANRNTSLCLALGISWIYSAQGLLQKALPLLEGARIMLASTNDWINQAYVNLLYGRVMRAIAGSDTDKLKEVVKELLTAYSSFGRHESYKSRAAYELSLAFLYNGEYDKALGRIHEVAKSAAKAGDTRWQARAMIVESRILRRRGWNLTDSHMLADRALLLAEKNKQLECQIEALIARGEVRLLQKEAAEAKDDFLRALKLAKNNSQTQAVCRLHLSRTCLVLDDWRSAESYFATWNSVKAQVENKTVHRQAADVRAEMDRRVKDFRIPSEEENLSLETHKRRLFEFLLEKAKRKYRNKEEMAKAMGISRANLIKKEQEIAKGKTEE